MMLHFSSAVQIRKKIFSSNTAIFYSGEVLVNTHFCDIYRWYNAHDQPTASQFVYYIHSTMVTSHIRISQPNPELPAFRGSLVAAGGTSGKGLIPSPAEGIALLASTLAILLAQARASVSGRATRHGGPDPAVSVFAYLSPSQPFTPSRPSGIFTLAAASSSTGCSHCIAASGWWAHMACNTSAGNMLLPLMLRSSGVSPQCKKVLFAIKHIA